MLTSKQVEWVEDKVMIGTTPHYKGDKTTFEDASEADQYIDAGWCKCVESGDIGNRVAGAVKMEVKNTYQAAQ